MVKAVTQFCHCTHSTLIFAAKPCCGFFNEPKETKENIPSPLEMNISQVQFSALDLIVKKGAGEQRPLKRE